MVPLAVALGKRAWSAGFGFLSGWGDGDVEAHGPELVDVGADLAVALALRSCQVGPRSPNLASGLLRRCQMMTRMERPTAHLALRKSFSKRRKLASGANAGWHRTRRVPSRSRRGPPGGCADRSAQRREPKNSTRTRKTRNSSASRSGNSASTPNRHWLESGPLRRERATFQIHDRPGGLRSQPHFTTLPYPASNPLPKQRGQFSHVSHLIQVEAGVNEPVHRLRGETGAGVAGAVLELGD
jgi:hypothetical protein